MPTLDWIGKDKVINHHKDVPYKVLERKYSFDEGGMHKEDIHSNNMIIHGDNLEALKSFLPQYEGKIKCIYIDPPYNTGNEGWIYNDNVNDPKIKKWLGEVVGKEGEDLSRHDKWLCMMYPRLVLLQKLLAEDGAIFISIDDNEHANLLLVCNEIFGSNNFIQDIIWNKRVSPARDAKFFSTDHEYILVYSKNKESLTTHFCLEQKRIIHITKIQIMIQEDLGILLLIHVINQGMRDLICIIQSQIHIQVKKSSQRKAQCGLIRKKLINSMLEIIFCIGE